MVQQSTVEPTSLQSDGANGNGNVSTQNRGYYEVMTPETDNLESSIIPEYTRLQIHNDEENASGLVQPHQSRMSQDEVLQTRIYQNVSRLQEPDQTRLYQNTDIPQSDQAVQYTELQRVHEHSLHNNPYEQLQRETQDYVNVPQSGGN